MSLKSVLQNKITVNILFFLFLFCSLMSFLWTFLCHDEFLIPMFGRLNDNLVINFELPENLRENFHFFVDGYEIRPFSVIKGSQYGIIQEDNSKAQYLSFKADNKETIDKLDNIVIVLNKNLYYFSKDDIKKFAKTNSGSYILPFNLKYFKNSKYPTDKGALHNFFISFMSIFYNTNFYIFPLSFLFLAVLVYLNNKNKIEINFNLLKQSAIWWILILGLLFRIQDNSFPFWGDELYTAMITANPDLPYSKLFVDPGNPPFFFFLAKIWMILFGTGEGVSRLLPALFSVLTIGAVYFFVKKHVNYKVAILSSFLLCVNVYSIHSAQEFRCYSLCALFSVVAGYYLFEIVKYKKNKDFIIYGVLAALMANTHFFQILILMTNFLLAMFFLDNKSRLKFFYANLFGAICFLPYFLITGLNQGLLDENFNQMALYNLYATWTMFYCFFASKFIASLVLILPPLLLIPKVRKICLKEENETLTMFFFSFYMIVALFISSFTFSHLVRPVIRNYYYIEIIAFIPIFISCAIFLPFKNKILKCFVSCAFLLFSAFNITGKGIYTDKDDLLVIRIEETFKYAYYDQVKFLKQNKKIGITMFDFIDYTKYYKDYFRGSEAISIYKFGLHTGDLVRSKLDETGADVVYFMLHKATSKEFFDFLKEKYELSILLTDKTVLLARAIKKGK